MQVRIFVVPVTYGYTVDYTQQQELSHAGVPPLTRTLSGGVLLRHTRTLQPADT